MPHVSFSARRFGLATVIVITAISFVPQVAIATPITLGQIDTFQDGTTQNWTNGGAADPINVSTGGPAGSGDRFLEIQSGSFGGGSRLISFNNNQWLGNYIAAGVNKITLDLKDLSTQPLSIRVALRSTAGNSGTPGYVSTTPVSLTNDGLWHHVSFLIDGADLTAINGPAPLASFLTSVGDFRLLSSSSPSLVGDSLSGQFGVDNIQAVAVPDPSSAMALSLGAAGLVRIRAAGAGAIQNLLLDRSRRSDAAVETQPAVTLEIIELASPLQIAEAAPTEVMSHGQMLGGQRLLRAPQMIQRNPRIDVVRRVLHDVVDQAVDSTGEIGVRRAQHLSGVEGPLVEILKPGDRGMRVLEIGDEANQPQGDQAGDHLRRHDQQRRVDRRAQSPRDGQRGPGLPNDTDEHEQIVERPGEARFSPPRFRLHDENLANENLIEIIEPERRPPAIEPHEAPPPGRQAPILLERERRPDMIALLEIRPAVMHMIVGMDPTGVGVPSGQECQAGQDRVERVKWREGIVGRVVGDHEQQRCRQTRQRGQDRPQPPGSGNRRHPSGQIDRRRGNQQGQRGKQAAAARCAGHRGPDLARIRQWLDLGHERSGILEKEEIGKSAARLPSLDCRPIACPLS